MDFDFLGLDRRYEPVVIAFYAKTLLSNISKIYKIDATTSICFFEETITVYYKIDEHTNKVVKFVHNKLKETVILKNKYELERWDKEGHLIEHKYYFKK
jgi:hypothetical protein